MLDVIEEKLKSLSDREKYVDKLENMKKLRLIDQKTNNDVKLTKEELKFLYELEDKIMVFGWGKDPKVEEIKARRNPKKDLSRIECTFYDYPEGEEEIPEFKVKLTASKLLKIINGVQTRVNNQLSNESKVDQIEKTDYLKQLFYEHQIQEDEEDENSKRPKETGLSPERIESGISSVGHLEIDKNEQIK